MINKSRIFSFNINVYFNYMLINLDKKSLVLYLTNQNKMERKVAFNNFVLRLFIIILMKMINECICIVSVR